MKYRWPLGLLALVLLIAVSLQAEAAILYVTSFEGD